MSRSIKKDLYNYKNLNIKTKKWIKIFNKSLIILPNYENKIFLIYNGKIFIKIKISKEMIGYKFGEFISTRKRNFFTKKNKKK